MSVANKFVVIMSNVMYTGMLYVI